MNTGQDRRAHPRTVIHAESAGVPKQRSNMTAPADDSDAHPRQLHTEEVSDRDAAKIHELVEAAEIERVRAVP